MRARLIAALGIKDKSGQSGAKSKVTQSKINQEKICRAGEGKVITILTSAPSAGICDPSTE